MRQIKQQIRFKFAYKQQQKIRKDIRFKFPCNKFKFPHNKLDNNYLRINNNKAGRKLGSNFLATNFNFLLTKTAIRLNFLVTNSNFLLTKTAIRLNFLATNSNFPQTKRVIRLNIKFPCGKQTQISLRYITQQIGFKFSNSLVTN